MLSRGWEGARSGKAHLVGAAGSGMRSLAHVLAQMGWRVTGSDASVRQPEAPIGIDTPSPAPPPKIAVVTENSDRPTVAGDRSLLIAAGHAAEHVDPDSEVVIYSDAVPASNPELRRAAELGIPTYSYFEFLGHLMWQRRGIAIAGTHGKSTAAAMLAKILVDAGEDPTVIFGAATSEEWSGGRAGKGPLLLVEACEYNTNFLNLFPVNAAILGVELDHVDCFADEDQLCHAFALFAGSLPKDGLLVVRHDCLLARKAAAMARARVETFGLDTKATWTAEHVAQTNGRYEFTLLRHRRLMTRIRLQVAGRHNVYNALAAAALAWENGIEAEAIQWGLESFHGINRRLEVRGVFNGVTVVDDYAHHPSAVRAGLETMREVAPNGRVTCVFQPHQLSRLQAMRSRFADALALADEVILLPVWHARERATPAADAELRLLMDDLRRRGTDVLLATEKDAPARRAAETLRFGDAVVFMAAGEIQRVIDGVIHRLRGDRAAG